MATSMRGGFTFNGVHSSTYGVRETPASRILSPLKRRNLITIPGRSNAYIQEDGGYDPRVESIVCSYGRQYGVDIHEQIRKIAGWLTGIGELTFDYEPNLHYMAFVSTPPSVVTMLEFSQFQVEFTMAHPFAYETAIKESKLIGGTPGNDVAIIETSGTIETPVKLFIKNHTNSVIKRIKIYHKFLK